MEIEKCSKCGCEIAENEARYFTQEDENAVVCEDCFIQYVGDNLNKKYLTVQDLIDRLQEVQDKSLPVYMYVEDNIIGVGDVDTSILDRVDLNPISEV